jgi:hypothetical protein
MEKSRIRDIHPGSATLNLIYLEVLLLEVGPEPFDDLAPGQLLVLLGAHNGGQGWGQGHRLRESVHLDKQLLFSVADQDPGSGINIQDKFSDSLGTDFRVKSRYLNSLMRIRIQDPGLKISDPG